MYRSQTRHKCIQDTSIVPMCTSMCERKVANVYDDS